MDSIRVICVAIELSRRFNANLQNILFIHNEMIQMIMTLQKKKKEKQKQKKNQEN